MKKFIAKYMLVVGGLLTLNSCADFQEINTNPNAATSVSPQMLATNLILNITSVSYLDPMLLSKAINHTEFPSSMQYNNLGKQEYSGFVVLTNVAKMINLAPEGAQKNAYTGLGKFVRAWRFYEMTMRLGDIPYADALQGETGTIRPAYSTQKEVFLAILKELEEADQAFSQGANFAGDPIYNGDVAKWRKVVNTFALKVLLSLSAKEADTDLNIKSRFNTIVTTKPIFQSSADNFQRVYSDVAGQRYPWFKLNNQGLIYTVMSTMIVDKLKELEDYRLFYYAAPSPIKIAAGVSASSYDAYRAVNPSAVYSDLTAVASSKDYSNLNARYSELANSEPIYLIGYPVLQFMLAEASLRGWISGTPTSTYYENAIRASMQFTANNTPDNADFHHNRKINADYITSYLASDKVKLSGTTQQQLEKIMTQRYLGTFLQSGFDSYFENRRTGFPVFPVNPLSNNNTDKDKIPVRWMYPDTEINYNYDNLTKAIQSQYGGNDDYNQKMWLLK
ncbi:SusD/RagB family nutrient-binding outer membrane lipoprotein [Dyadobacter sp. LHD-138]|uniref:SusD/RagB family nutrient-binding outer membrane lipoprotein n=1 Tax=Dyadobacter sp. LHD-138 TaxID=3071413 RepID=UPI0027DF5F98|nr:SusD/RagB family nutrient-binding outer membrane lipoprotein [Dyadobacter sp. LHD-138]MDQ6482047.1 SusD/RagB family nutrient-binding outer membrane lipoprotein [Dyadobacter sp. LHD-138]